tara:strand:+ start:3927 stop:4121 length:195 start_codon:yes stop_codon:yes gene_type:complete
MSKTMDRIHEIFKKTDSDNFMPVDLKNIELLTMGLSFEEELEVGMIFEGIDLYISDKNNKVWNP